MVALALCASLGGLAPTLGAQLAVDRVDLTLVPRSATERAGTITVTNTSDRPVAATVYTADWDRDVDGANRFHELGTLPRSCGVSLRVFPRTISLPPRSAQALQVIADGADSLTATCWAIVFVETRLPPAPGESRQLSYVLRTGVKVYMVPPGLSADGVVEDMRLYAGPTATPASVPPVVAAHGLEVVFRNAGAVPLVARGRVEIRRPDNAIEATIQIEEFPTLPGARRRLALDLPSLATGRYVALALLDFGGVEIVAGQLELEVP